jgi:hypothetical protein
MGLYLTFRGRISFGLNQVIRLDRRFLILKRRWVLWFLLTWVMEVMVEALFLVGGTYFDIKLIKVD